MKIIKRYRDGRIKVEIESGPLIAYETGDFIEIHGKDYRIENRDGECLILLPVY